MPSKKPSLVDEVLSADKHPVTPSGAKFSGNRDILEKMEEITYYLKRLDRRDRMRTWGGFLRGMISLIPIVIIAIGAWYAYTNTDALISKITEQTTKQMMQFMQPKEGSSESDLLKRLEGIIKR